MFKHNEDAFSSVGQAQKPNKEVQEVNRPIKWKLEPTNNKFSNSTEIEPEKERKKSLRERQVEKSG